MHVASLPTSSVLAAPKPTDFPNLNIILNIIDQLKCDMYDNALIPKLVSLADHPSGKVLERFAKSHVSGTA